VPAPVRNFQKVAGPEFFRSGFYLPRYPHK
jgi:hypothetical protein